MPAKNAKQSIKNQEKKSVETKKKYCQITTYFQSSYIKKWNVDNLFADEKQTTDMWFHSGISEHLWSFKEYEKNNHTFT